MGENLAPRINHGRELPCVNFTEKYPSQGLSGSRAPLSVAQRFGLLALKGDATDLANYRGLAKCSQLYKLTGLMIAERWKRRLPAVILECQHGFMFLRMLFENIFKVLDAEDTADLR